jgi:hypothetical protein
MSVTSITVRSDEQMVRRILEDAGPRGASHEDFVEASLARDYIAILRRLVDVRGLQIRTDFATGQARWALVTDPGPYLRAA